MRSCDSETEAQKCFAWTMTTPDSDAERLPPKASGSYFTPHDVAACLVSWVAHQPTDRMLDPSCGDGRFLALHRNAVGIEQDALSARQAIERAPSALVHEGDFFAWATETAERFECAAGNPPFIRYQTFVGETRRRAIALCKSQGADFNGLAASWAPFLVATAALLKPGGAMAFIVPAEIGHAPYAAPLLEYLVRSFAEVRVIAVRDKLFPTLSEDCWLLYAAGRGGQTDRIGLTAVNQFKPSRHLPRAELWIDIDEWRGAWNRRLRPYLLPLAFRKLYQAGGADAGSRRLAEFATINIGYVSGDNSFFHLRPSEAKSWKIDSAYLHPSLRNGRAMPQRQITKATLAAWERNDDAVLLLRLQRGQDLPSGIRRYLDSSAGREARLGYKCRHRTPWYAVPDVQIPDYIMAYMSGRAVNLVRNMAGVTCTNSVHSVRVKDAALAKDLLPLWNTPFVRLSCELEGHSLGGGMLKLEPREAGRLLFPSRDFVTAASAEVFSEAIATMQRWRHYA
jgi:adenine-specific DNA-methyltransferase